MLIDTICSLANWPVDLRLPRHIVGWTLGTALAALANVQGGQREEPKDKLSDPQNANKLSSKADGRRTLPSTLGSLVRSKP
jgi:hypothetical protein